MLALLRRWVGMVTPGGRGLLGLIIAGWLVVGFTGLDEVRILVAMAAICLVTGLVWLLLPQRVDAELRLRPKRTWVGETSTLEVEAVNAGRLPLWQPRVDLRVADASRTLALPVLRPGAPYVETVLLEGSRRGVHRVGPLTSRIHDPLWLVRRDLTWAEEVVWFVRPRIVPVDTLAMGAVADLEGMPSDQISMSDLSFHALREYTRGDDLRHVHWRSSAKASTLLVRQYHDTRRSHATVIVDADANAYDHVNDFELALSVGASVVHRVAQQDFDLTFVCGDISADRLPSEEVLDSFCRAEFDHTGLVEAGRHAAALAPETSLLLVCTGRRRDDAVVQQALAPFPNDVRRIVLRCAKGEQPALRGAEGIALVSIGELEQLAPLLGQISSGAQR